MSKQSSLSDDSSLNIAFFSVLFVALSLLFVFLEGEAISEEGQEEMAVLSSPESVFKEDLKSGDSLLSNGYLLVNSPPSYHKPQVLAMKAEEEKEDGKENEEKDEKKEYKERWVRVTGYAPLDPNATEGMCFSGDPALTASGTRSREGIVAANFLPFGTKIRIPSIFGDREFTVEDRMSSRFTNTVDIVFSSQREAFDFGTKQAYIEIIK